MSQITAYFDGCCEPVNPGGNASYGIHVAKDGEVVEAMGQYVGGGKFMSNNVAEFEGVLKALRVIRDVGCTGADVLIRGDSKLVIGLLYGIDGKQWKSHSGLYVPIYKKALEVLMEIRVRAKSVKFEWIPREENSICDVYSKQVLLDLGVKFRIQPEEKKNGSANKNQMEG